MKSTQFKLLITLPVSITLAIIFFYTNKEEYKVNEIKLPSDWFYEQRAFPYDQVNNDSYFESIEKVLESRNSLRSRKPLKSWKSVGPINIGGRITDVEMPNDDTEIIYAGTASGGVFKSINAGLTWQPIFDQEKSLSIGDLAIASSNPNIIYVGTGEANAGGGSTTYDGAGVFKSTNAGQSWSYVGLEKIRNTGRIVINPKNAQNVFVAGMGDLYSNSTERGIYRTTNGGTTWEKVLYINDSTGGIDLAINPLNPNILYAAMWERVRRINKRSYGGSSCNIYQSKDGGTSWNKLGNGLPIANNNSGRIGLCISESNPDIVYAIFADKTGYFNGLYKTTNGGSNWTRVNDSSLGNLFASFGWWFGRISVDPTNPNRVFAIGYELHSSDDGGANWKDIGSQIHVDHHSVYVHPKNPDLVVLGNDGGIYLSQDGGELWRHASNMPITQFYTCEMDYQNPQRLYGGAQDNNVIRTLTGSNNNWNDILGGDGLVVLVDPKNNSNIYAESQYGNLHKSIDGGLNFSKSINGILSSERKNWNTPIVFDPNNSSILYYGSSRVYKTEDRASNWMAISPDLTNGNAGNNLGTITAIAVASSNSKVIYSGTDDGNVWTTNNGGLNWTKVSSALPNRWITRIAVDLQNSSVAYVTLSGFRKNEYLSHIFQTKDAGISWQDVSGNLPEVPLNDVVIDPYDNTTLYVASDVGVYKGSYSGNWDLLGDSLPLVPISDLTLHHPTRKLLAATYGRSMFQFELGIPTSIEKTENFLKTTFSIVNNPITTFINIQINSSEKQFGKIQLYDLNGKQVCNLFEGFLSSGEQDFKFDIRFLPCSNLNTGAYFCNLTINKSTFTKKIVVLK